MLLSLYLAVLDDQSKEEQFIDLPDVGALVNKAPYMDGQLAAVHIICLVAQQIEKLGVDHRNQEVEGGIRVRHDEK